MSLDDLRKQALDADDDPFVDFEEFSVNRQEITDDRLFGMTSIERMFLSIGLFLVVSVLSFLLLLMTESITLP